MKDSYLAQFYGKSQNYTDIPNKWYKEYNVKKGLRNEDGTGVRVGLTRVADVVGYEETPEGGIKAIPGKLYYRGYDVEDLVKGKQDSHFGYEEICFLLLFGYLPKKAELEHFRNILTDCYEIPDCLLYTSHIQGSEVFPYYRKNHLLYIPYFWHLLFWQKLFAVHREHWHK